MSMNRTMDSLRPWDNERGGIRCWSGSDGGLSRPNPANPPVEAEEEGGDDDKNESARLRSHGSAGQLGGTAEGGIEEMARHRLSVVAGVGAAVEEHRAVVVGEMPADGEPDTADP